MATCTVSSIKIDRNKWEDQKIRKFYIKKHKGVASRQHTFPKLSSNSARPWVRNWAKISKLQCRVKHKNQCNDYCNEIQKYPRLLDNEMELTSSNAPYNKTNEKSYVAETFSPITLSQYVDVALAEYDNDHDDFLQIALQQSFETYSSKLASKESTHTKHRNSFKILPKATANKKHISDKVSKTESDNVDIKVRIDLHNIFGVDYNDINPHDYITNVDKTWIYSKQYHGNRTEVCYKITTLPYELKRCHMEIRIDDKLFSFDYIPHRDTEYAQYAVMIEYETSLMESSKEIIPIYFEKHNDLYSYSHFNENRRLFQIAQKCFESIIPQSRCLEWSKWREQYMHTLCLPQWKYSDIHQQNNSFMPCICKLNEILSEYIPIPDIVNGVLIAYIGYSEFESVGIHSRVHVTKDCKREWVKHIEEQEECDKVSMIKLQSGTNYGFKYIEPFSNDAITSYAQPKIVYTYDAIKYDSIGTEPAYAGFDYSISRCRSKTCVVSDKKARVRIPRTKTSKSNYFDDGRYPEEEIKKDLKKKKTKGKKRKRWNRKYVIKPKVKHSRRKERKKKYRNNVHHPCTPKQKHAKFKKRNGLKLDRHNRWIRGSYIGFIAYTPNYVFEYKIMDHQPRWGNKRGRTNKHFAPKKGRKYTRLF